LGIIDRDPFVNAHHVQVVFAYGKSFILICPEVSDGVLSTDQPSPDIMRRMRQIVGKDGSKKLDSSRPASSRTPLGISGLDEVLGGGLPQGRSIIVVGEPGAGKTILCSQFLINGIERFTENGIFVSLKDAKSHYEWEMNQFGWDFVSAEKQGKFSFIDASPFRPNPGEVKNGELAIGHKDFSLPSLLDLIRNDAKAINAGRIVVDSLSMLELQYPDANQRRKAVLGVAEALAETGATCVLTTDFTSIALEPFTALQNFLLFTTMQFEKQLFHGVITMQTVVTVTGGERPITVMERVVQVQKMRGTRTDRQARPYRITERGIEVYSKESAI
jgi:circadian clock protein KaiC